MKDIFYWDAYGDEGKIKYAVYASLGFTGLTEHFEGKRKRAAKKGDMHRMNTGGYLLSQKMVELMGGFLEKYGTLKKMRAKDRKDFLFLYTVNNILNCIDYEKSIKYIAYHQMSVSYKNPFPMSISEIIKPIVDEKKYDGSTIFTLSKQIKFGEYYFVTEDFIEEVRRHNLKGFKFFRCDPMSNSDDSDCQKKFEFGR